MIVWAFIAAGALFIITVALLRFNLLTRQAEDLQKTIDSVKTELAPKAQDLVDDLKEIRTRIEGIRSPGGQDPDRGSR